MSRNAGRKQAGANSTKDRLEGKLKARENAEREAEEAQKRGLAEQIKDDANALFSNGDFHGAMQGFSMAIELDPFNAVLFSNRSAANLSLKRTRDAVTDAEKCVGLKPQWAKGFSRLGAALLADKQPARAVEAFRNGLKLEATNEVMLKGLVEAQEAARTVELEKSAEEAAQKAETATAAPKVVEPVIGIDLGTTFSCVAVWKDDGVQILTDEDGAKTVPSYVGWTAEGERMIGHRAKTNAAKNVARTVYDIKRIIGQRTTDEAVQKERKRLPFTIVEGEDKKPVVEIETKPGSKQQFAPEEISAMVLGKMKAIAERNLGHPVKKAVVTVPAYFNDAQRLATKNAGAIAGLEVMRVINEPTAAALAYGLDQKAEASKAGSNVLIFDLGGGTFDATALRIEEGVFEVLATGGDTRLGGEDFDNAFVDWLQTEFRNKKNLDIREPRDVRKLRSAAEAAKRQMSSSATVKVEVTIDGEEHFLDVKREQFDKLNMKHFNRTLDTVKSVLRDASLQASQIDDVVLVGGSTRVLKIQELLSEFFGGRQLCRSINPDEAVAYGAAVQGAILAGVRHSACDSIVLVDVTPLSLGVEVQGSMMSTIIPRNTPIPCTKRDKYTSTVDYQEAFNIRIFEGERPTTEDNHLLGEFSISGIEIAKKGECECEVTFQLDSNGILTVTAKDKKTGANAEATISNACKGLSQTEIDRMVQEAERFEREDAELLRKVQLKNEIESMAFDVASIDKFLHSETLDWLDNLDLATCPLITLETRHKELARLL